MAKMTESLFDIELGRELRTILEKKNLTAHHIALNCGLDLIQVEKLINPSFEESSTLSIRDVHKIAKFLGYDFQSTNISVTFTKKKN